MRECTWVCVCNGVGETKEHGYDQTAGHRSLYNGSAVSDKLIWESQNNIFQLVNKSKKVAFFPIQPNNLSGCGRLNPLKSDLEDFSLKKFSSWC